MESAFIIRIDNKQKNINNINHKTNQNNIKTLVIKLSHPLDTVIGEDESGDVCLQTLQQLRAHMR